MPISSTAVKPLVGAVSITRQPVGAVTVSSLNSGASGFSSRRSSRMLWSMSSGTRKPPSVPTGLPPKNLVTYRRLACFLGAFGVHDFYAGYTVRGVWHVIITLFPLLLIFSWLWALVEMFVAKKDANGNLVVELKVPKLGKKIGKVIGISALAAGVLGVLFIEVIARHLPNGTDVTCLKIVLILGFVFAFAGIVLGIVAAVNKRWLGIGGIVLGILMFALEYESLKYAFSSEQIPGSVVSSSQNSVGRAEETENWAKGVGRAVSGK